MNEIFSKVNADVLLLDEWDQNMDEANKLLAKMLIKDHAQRTCIIDVRHGTIQAVESSVR